MPFFMKETFFMKECFSAIKKEKILPLVTIQIKLESIVLSEVS